MMKGTGGREMFWMDSHLALEPSLMPIMSLCTLAFTRCRSMCAMERCTTGLDNGKRYGAGILYDRRGDMCYDGVWIDDAPPIASVAIDSVLRLHNHVEEVTVSNYCCNELSTLSFTRFDALRSLHVGNNCFRSVDRLWLEGLPRLADLLVGDRCFSEVSIDTERRKNPKRSFRVRQCPQLRSIRVGCYSFSDYASFCVESECRIAL